MKFSSNGDVTAFTQDMFTVKLDYSVETGSFLLDSNVMIDFRISDGASCLINFKYWAVIG